MKNNRKNYNKTITKILYSIKHGDKEKMDDLFTKTFNHFYGYALVKVWNKSKAEDAVMSMYENVIRYIGSFDADKDGMGWMFTIINRIIYNLNAEEKEIQKYEQPIPDDEKYLIELNQMYKTIELYEAVSDMDDINKKIVFLYYFERRTLNEIADALNLSISTIHKRKQIIVKKLKKFLI
ncbi:MAG: sigma-70 family RNA polymerase sigma factor [Clostridiales bacterium]|nr:sigma-70 family RNA polymerase sigma factor [Clostridiales bacterium]